MKLKLKLHVETRRIINFTKPICISQVMTSLWIKKLFIGNWVRFLKAGCTTKCKNVKHLGLLLAKNAYCKLNNKLWWVAQCDKIISEEVFILNYCHTHYFHNSGDIFDKVIIYYERKGSLKEIVFLQK